LGDRNPHRLVGTDLVHAIPVALLGGAGYAIAGLLDANLLGLMLVGAIPGSIAGSFSSLKLKSDMLRPVLATALLVAATLIFLSGV